MEMNVQLSMHWCSVCIIIDDDGRTDGRCQYKQNQYRMNLCILMHSTNIILRTIRIMSYLYVLYRATSNRWRTLHPLLLSSFSYQTEADVACKFWIVIIIVLRRARAAPAPPLMYARGGRLNQRNIIMNSESTIRDASRSKLLADIANCKYMRGFWQLQGTYYAAVNLIERNIIYTSMDAN